MKRRKWLWILFILFGFGKLSINWTTGQWGVMVLAAQLFSASAAAAYFGPWIVSVSLPVGAVLFLIKRRRLEESTVVHDGTLVPIENAKSGDIV
jgi:asparagine N-glycosylation enzyme membrane subunit Stt3